MNNTTQVNETITRGNGSYGNGSHVGDEDVEFVARATSFYTLGAVILLANLISIATFTCSNQMRKRRSNYLLTVLSIADFLVGVNTLMVATILLNLSRTVLYVAVAEYIDTISGLASVLTLASISVERFYAVVFPFKHRQIGLKFYVILASVPWILGMFSATFRYMYQGTKHENLFLLVDDCILVVTLAFAITIITVCYASVAYKIRKRKHQGIMNHKKVLRDQKLAVTLCFLTVASLVAWCPYTIYFAYSMYFCSTCTFSNLLVYLLRLLRYLNSGINVIFYAAKMPRFRKAFWALILRRKTRMILISKSANSGYWWIRGLSNKGMDRSQETKL